MARLGDASGSCKVGNVGSLVFNASCRGHPSCGHDEHGRVDTFWLDNGDEMGTKEEASSQSNQVHMGRRCTTMPSVGVVGVSIGDKP